MPKQPNSVDADALLRSLAPVVAKPDPTPSSATPRLTPPAAKPVTRELSPAAEQDEAPSQQSPSREPVGSRDATATGATAAAEPPRRAARRAAPSSGGARARMDVAINPGEGSTALYVRVPRTTHVALKLLALQNQASLEGPTDLATIVRTAIDEFLDRQQSSVRAAG